MTERRAYIVTVLVALMLVVAVTIYCHAGDTMCAAKCALQGPW